MQIRLVEYKEGVPVDVHEEYDATKLDIEFIDWNYTKPLSMNGTVEKGLDTVSFRGRLKSRVEQVCGRCLKKIEANVDAPFDLYYQTTDKDVIETIDDLREVLILEHPISFVCQENCKGLCSQCGVNRNETACNCNAQMQSTPNAFAQLKKIWHQGREE
jgi:uncharacterized protein